ncbi:MAG: lytic transglycosylase domain-containing protein [Bryobacteraceae bacterium]
MRIWILLLLALSQAYGEDFLAAQRASIARQRAAIRQQKPLQYQAVVMSAPVVRPRCAAIEAPELGRMIELAAETHQVPFEVVREVARQESAFHPCAVSPKGAEGLMQLMPATQASLGVQNPFDPEESLMAGAQLLRELLSRYNGSIPLALSAYNAGPKKVDRADGIPAIAETRQYVAQILSRLTD